MTGVHQAVAASGVRPPGNIYDIIASLGLTTNLNFALDAGDTRCTDGTSQTWTDAGASGNNFFRGATSGVTANDPTFNGSAGSIGSGTYWSFDGADYFVESAAHTFADGWHKDNGAFTLVFIVWFGNITSDQILFNTFDSVNGDGVTFFVDNAAGEFALQHSLTNASSEVVGTGVNASAGAWGFVGISFSEAGPTCNFRYNGSTATPTVLGSTNTTDPSTLYSIACGDSGSTPLSNTSRLIAVAGWSTALGADGLTSLYNAFKARRLTSIP